MKAVWAPEAVSDRHEIYEYVEAEDANEAIALDDLFSKAAARLVLHPKAGRPGRVDGTREFVVHRHYIVVYDLVGKSIRIIRILHTARQWPPASRP